MVETPDEWEAAVGISITLTSADIVAIVSALREAEEKAASESRHMEQRVYRTTFRKIENLNILRDYTLREN